MWSADELRDALHNGQFTVYYQPIVHVRTGRISKAEALIRWTHPQRGNIPPDKFIEDAEETGAIVEIGDWVFKEAARQAGRWSQRLPGFQISVNKSPRQFSEAGQAAAWIAHLDETKTAGAGLVIEITEGLMLRGGEDVIQRLAMYRTNGLQLAIDDFGTGYSALRYLKNFQFDYLKIDRAFMKDVPGERFDRAMVDSLVYLAHRLDITVIAEGIETEEQRLFLAEINCDYAQGYLFSPPVPADQFEALAPGLK